MTRRADIFISVAEASADQHAAALVRAARRRLPGCRFFGLAGPRMRGAGVESIGDMTAQAAMLGGIASNAGLASQMSRRIQDAWKSRRPDLVILMDSSVFHLKSSPFHRAPAPLARSMGLRVLYYIAPQTWASRRKRIRTLARVVDRVACILPFEEPFFRAAGISAEYVGHPLFESLAAETPDPAVVEKLRRPGAPLVAILPGSRRHVIEKMLPLQLEVIRRVRAMIAAEPAAGRAGLTVALSCASPEHYDQIRACAAASGVNTAIVVADTASLLSACDLALVTSGTATLTAGYHRKPIVVMYDAGGSLGPLYDLVGGRVVKTPHLSLLNILAGRRIVPEFMPFVPDAEPVARVVRDLLFDEPWRRLMIRQIDQTIAPLEESRASQNVCEMIRRLLVP